MATINDTSGANQQRLILEPAARCACGICALGRSSLRRWSLGLFSLGLSRLGTWSLGLRSLCLWLLGIWLAAGICAIGYAAPAGWSPTWSDEFDGSRVDTSKWDPILWTTPFNSEQQAYHPSRVTVAGGNLVLTADDANFGGKLYTSGKVESKFTQQHGRWEIRAKLPGTQGTWPAIWLLPDTGAFPWPSQGEIDILENRGNQPHLTSSAFHHGANFQTRRFTFEEQKATNGGQAENYHEAFHTYAVEWDATKLRFFVDDVHYHTVSNAETGGFLGNQTAPVEINLNVAVGGNTVIMSFSYYNDFGGEFGSSSYLSSTSIAIADANTSNDAWLPVNLADTVPAGAVEARLSFVFVQPEFDGGAIHIDNVRFTNLDLEFDADADSDGDVDGADFLSWQKGFDLSDGSSVAVGDFNFDGVVDASDLAVWSPSYGAVAEVSAITVPEPTSQMLLPLFFLACFTTRLLP